MSKRQDFELLCDIKGELAGLMDRLIHQYFGVNFNIVWRIIKQELPELVRQI